MWVNQAFLEVALPGDGKGRGGFEPDNAKLKDRFTQIQMDDSRCSGEDRVFYGHVYIPITSTTYLHYTAPDIVSGVEWSFHTPLDEIGLQIEWVTVWMINNWGQDSWVMTAEFNSELKG